MTIFFHPRFEKSFKKLKPGQKEKFKEKKYIFLRDPFDPILNNHPLKGKYQGFRSINISGDLRVIYKMVNSDTVVFATIDTHSNLYK